jgi:pimeloyl-ACP methyl ester carboxylesterase
MSMPLVQREILVDGVRLGFLEREASGVGLAPIVLLHGIAASAWTLEALIAELPCERRVVALNLPGSEMGGSAELSDVSLRGLAWQVRDCARMMGLERPVVLGHSHGGAIALQVAASFPEDVSGLILLCPAHPFLLRERWIVAFYNSWPGHVVGHSIRWIPEWMQGVGFSRLLGPAGRKVGINWRPYRQPFKRRDNVVQLLRLLKSWSADMDALGVQITEHKILAPTLFLWGDADSIVPIETAASLERCVQEWELVTLRGVGHLPNDEAAAECGSAIRAWLDGGR